MVPSLSQPLPAHFLLLFFLSSRSDSSENQTFSKKISWACNTFGWVSGAAKGKGGKPIIKIWKLNLRLFRRRENAVQRTPPRAHSSGADYGIYHVQPTRAFSESISNHLESCTPGQDWAKCYILVCTGTYQYNTV